VSYGEPHILIITRLPVEGEYEEEVEYEILHRDDCPQETITYNPTMPFRPFSLDEPEPSKDDVTETYYTCGVAYEVDGIGLEGLTWEAAVVPGWVKPEGGTGYDDWKGLPSGRYLIRFWSSMSYYQEYDGGLELLGEAPEGVGGTDFGIELLGREGEIVANVE
jgi:hypothetical protein